VYLSVRLSSYKLLNHLVEFYEIQLGGHDTEGDINAIIFNPVASTVPKWWTFMTSDVDAKLAPVNVGPCNFTC
jgi:hypothetical protein